MKTVTIDVTQDDIDRGIRGTCRGCPVALAVNRHLRPGLRSHVGGRYIDIENVLDGTSWTTRLPFNPEFFVPGFDAYVPAKPFSFKLDLLGTDVRPSAPDEVPAP